jgi:hypothetical protein
MWGVRGLAALFMTPVLVAGCTSSRTSSQSFETVTADAVRSDETPTPSAPADYDAPFLGSRVLAAVPGRLLLLDDHGRVTATTPLSGRAGPVTGPDGTRYSYDSGRLMPAGGPEWRQPAPDVLLFGRKWTLPVPGKVLAVVDRPYGPLVLAGGPGRCAVDQLGEGRQAFTDGAEDPFSAWSQRLGPDAPRWRLERCLAGAVDPHGRLAVLVLDVDGAPDRLAVTTVDLGSLQVVHRADLRTIPGPVGAATFVSLTDGLVVYVATRGGAYLVDLRGDAPAVHRLPGGLGGSVSVAGRDAVYVYGAGYAVARVTVSSGAVTRNALPAAYGATTLFTVP